MAAPFFGVFGNTGFWVFPQMSILLLLFSTYRIGCEICRKDVGLALLISVGLLTQTLLHSYMFSYDLPLTALLICGLDLLRSRPFLGGFISSLSVFARPSCLVLLPFLLGAWPEVVHKRRDILSAVFGIGTVLVLFLLVNHILWGNPFETSYHHVPAFDRGNIVPYPHPTGVDVGVLVSNWSSKLFGFDVGLLRYNWALMMFPLVLWTLRHHPARMFLAVTMGAAITYAAYIFAYPMWFETIWGNRFLFPTVYLYLFSFLAFTEKIRSKLRIRRILTVHPTTAAKPAPTGTHVNHFAGLNYNR
jgi:hypothetical protein